MYCAPVMERHGHDRVGIREQIRSGLRHEVGEQSRDGPTPVVLQRLNQLAQRTFVSSGTARDGEGGW